MNRRFYIFATWLTMLACGAVNGTAIAAASWNSNLLVNPSCNNSDYTGWTKTNAGSGWGINTDDGRICWASSYELCAMEQTVNLLDSGFTATELDAQPVLILSGSYCCPWSGSITGKAKIIAYVLNESGDTLQTVTLTDVTYKAQDVPWTTIIKKIQLPIGSRSVKFYFAGKDSKGWTGQYGPRFDDMWVSLSTDGVIPSKAVSCATVANGSFSVNKTTANYGDTVKITVTPDTGYGLKHFNVTTSHGSVVTVAADSTFVMPMGYDVTVSGEFWKITGLNVICATVANGSFSVDKAIANTGDMVKITVTPDAGYALKQFNVTTSNGDVVTVAADSTFVMPAGYDVTVSGEFWKAHNVSDSTFFEGFESGYTHDVAVANIWVQQSESGTWAWTVNLTNTSKNRTPRNGAFNATLRNGNTDWLFTPVQLTAGETYEFEMYARQDDAPTSYANITVMLGQGLPDKTIMTDELVSTTGLTNGDYQKLSGRYTALKSGIFVLGIKGYISGTPYYLSIDDITFAKVTTRQINIDNTVANGSFSVDKAIANTGDMVKITVTPDAGYGLKQFNVTTSNGSVVAVAADSTFVMPMGYDVTVSGVFWKAHNVSESVFFEGFESGYTHDVAVANIWVQQSENGSKVWTVNQTNTSGNRTPRSGAFNATLYYGNTDWLFTLVQLTAGETYEFEMYARQDGLSTSYANITVMLGQGCVDKTIMTDTLVSTTGLTRGDYQKLSGSYIAKESDVFVLGIKGYINNYPLYLSIDDIKFAEKTQMITGVNTVANASLVLYPNPARDVAYLQINGLHADNLQVYDLAGRLVLTQRLSGSTIETIRIDGMATGVYQVKVGNETLKLVVR